MKKLLMLILAVVTASMVSSGLGAMERVVPFSNEILKAAVLTGDAGLVKKLIASVPVIQRADLLKTTDMDGKTALHICCENVSERCYDEWPGVHMIRTLVEAMPVAQRADFLKATDISGKTAMHYLLVQRKCCMAKALLDYYGPGSIDLSIKGQIAKIIVPVSAMISVLAFIATSAYHGILFPAVFPGFIVGVVVSAIANS